MKSEIIHHLSEGPLTFAALSNKLGNPPGDRAITAPDDHNIILWSSMSTAYAEAVVALRAAGLIQFDIWWPLQLGVVAYVNDGRILRLPLVTNPPDAGHRKPHWLPVAIGGAQ